MDAMQEKYILKKEINAFKCLRCQHEWIPRVPMEELTGAVKELPIICPHCKSAYWKTEPKNPRKKKK
jgi:uncharacterized protein with PIN domain